MLTPPLLFAAPLTKWLQACRISDNRRMRQDQLVHRHWWLWGLLLCKAQQVAGPLP